MKVVINDCFGIFNLSDEAKKLYQQISNMHSEESLISDDEISRIDPYLVEVVEKLGDKANGESARLVIEEIPDEYIEYEAWEIREYDGAEIIHKDECKMIWGRSYQKLQLENEQLLIENKQLQDEIKKLKN